MSNTKAAIVLLAIAFFLLMYALEAWPDSPVIGAAMLVLIVAAAAVKFLEFWRR